MHTCKERKRSCTKVRREVIWQKLCLNGLIQTEFILSPWSSCSSSWMSFWWSLCCWVSLRSASMVRSCMATSICFNAASCSWALSFSSSQCKRKWRSASRRQTTCRGLQIWERREQYRTTYITKQFNVQRSWMYPLWFTHRITAGICLH